ncbi:MAG: N-acylglucosamine 2-epimerase [Maribacter sp.]|nr:N-acylglucosamine 2-epimerase [Maribacter sp.]
MVAEEKDSYALELEFELKRILDYWQKQTLDTKYGGFIGRIDHFNNCIENAPKGIILNTRILWTFSRANNFYKDSRYANECLRAFAYLYDHFNDKRYGGVFWEVDHTGKPSNKRKQIYAQAFCIYALSEYYKYAKNSKALIWAMQLFNLVEEKAYDPEFGGYIEAFDENWQNLEDQRLSEKDLNAPKTTNTILHILEAYTTLYEITADAQIEKSLKRLIDLFLGKIFNSQNHLKLFFTRDWESMSTEISYGHDIEAAWLLCHAANVLGDAILVKKTNELLVAVVNTFTSEAIDVDFGVWNSKDSKTMAMDKDKHWWAQVEAMVGLCYAWIKTKDDSYFNHSRQIWDFTKNNIIDTKNGEWFFRVNATGVPYTFENKVGPWKCPYHNSRGLIEIISILNES